MLKNKSRLALTVAFTLIASLLLVLSCKKSKDPAAPNPAYPTATPSPTYPTATPTNTFTRTLTSTVTLTPTVTQSPTPVLTPICTIQPTAVAVVETTDFGDYCNITSAYNLGTLAGGMDAVATGSLGSASDRDAFMFNPGVAGNWHFYLDCLNREGQSYQFNIADPNNGCLVVESASGAGSPLFFHTMLSSPATYILTVFMTSGSAPVTYRAMIDGPF